jgi:outer membrane receptor for ferrienterochelin and colicin
MRTRACSSAVLAFWVLFGANACLLAQQKDPNSSKDVFEMSIDELMNVEVASTATLTDTTPRLVPAAVTTITHEDIVTSGARSLYELLDIYVPNLQWSRHHWENDVMGLRGIINDRDDKYMILVNGRNMNQRTHFGALSEQDQVLLSEIHHIDVVRGPGSALYGPGAVSMVINIITYNANTFQGTEVTGRGGVVEEFYTGEVKTTKRFDSNDGGIFIYAGAGSYNGATTSNAPQIFPVDFPAGSPGSAPVPGSGTKAGDPMISANVPRDNASAPDMDPAKVHIEITKGNLDMWMRYTRGGKEFCTASMLWGLPPVGWGGWFWNGMYNVHGEPSPKVVPDFYAYQQLTGFVGYTQELTERLSIDYALSYDTISVVEQRVTTPNDDCGEDNLYAKALLKWEPSDSHRIAFGPEYYHFDLGLSSLGGFGYSEPDIVAGGTMQYPQTQEWGNQTKMPRWSTDMYSLLGEWQWKITDQWTTFLGGRIDNHTFTDTMYSPRAAAVYTPTQRDTLKLMWTESVRTNFEAEMKKEYDATGQNSDPEKLQCTELRYERQQTKQLDLATSLYLHKLDVISWDQGASKADVVGDQKDWGIELEASYHTDKDRLTFSHGFTKLISFELKPGRTSTITAEPYSHNLTNWSNNISKLVYQHKLDDQWTFNGSLRVYWGFPGLEAYENYTGGDRVQDGWEKTYRGSYFLDLGLQYKANKHLQVAMNAYNVLGIFDSDLNKRNYIETSGAAGADFRDAAPALGVSVSYKF